MKKVGRIPNGGGWRIHGRNSAQKRAVDRAKTAGAKAGYLYLHSIVDGFSRLAYTEPLDDEKGTTAAAFLARAKVWFAAHGITHIHRIVTGNGACYRSNNFARIVGHRTRHQKTKPYTPRHNGKAEARRVEAAADLEASGWLPRRMRRPSAFALLLKWSRRDSASRWHRSSAATRHCCGCASWRRCGNWRRWRMRVFTSVSRSTSVPT